MWVFGAVGRQGVAGRGMLGEREACTLPGQKQGPAQWRGWGRRGGKSPSEEGTRTRVVAVAKQCRGQMEHF